MSTHTIHFMIKFEKFPKISINICFLGLSREFLLGFKNEFELAMVTSHRCSSNWGLPQ